MKCDFFEEPNIYPAHRAHLKVYLDQFSHIKIVDTTEDTCLQQLIAKVVKNQCANLFLFSTSVHKYISFFIRIQNWTEAFGIILSPWLENYLINMTECNLQEWWNSIVYTGPLYLPQKINGKHIVQYEVIGDPPISVPTHFFKVFALVFI